MIKIYSFYIKSGKYIIYDIFNVGVFFESGENTYFYYSDYKLKKVKPFLTNTDHFKINMCLDEINESLNSGNFKYDIINKYNPLCGYKFEKKFEKIELPKKEENLKETLQFLFEEIINYKKSRTDKLIKLLGGEEYED